MSCALYLRREVPDGRDVGLRVQGAYEVADVAAVHVQRPARVADGVARLAEVAEALRHAGRQVRLVEVGQPRRVILAGGAVESLLRPGKDGAAGLRRRTGHGQGSGEAVVPA